MGHLANRMRSLAAAGNPRAEELIEKADELDKMIDADAWDTEKVLCAWLQARKLWCEVTGEPLLHAVAAQRSPIDFAMARIADPAPCRQFSMRRLTSPV